MNVYVVNCFHTQDCYDECGETTTLQVFQDKAKAEGYLTRYLIDEYGDDYATEVFDEVEESVDENGNKEINAIDMEGGITRLYITEKTMKQKQ